MYTIMRQSGKTANGIQEFAVDTPEDLDLIPRSTIQLGDVAFVVSTSDVYAATSEGKWVKI